MTQPTDPGGDASGEHRDDAPTAGRGGSPEHATADLRSGPTAPAPSAAPAPATTTWLTPLSRWDLVRTTLVTAGLLLIVLAAASSGSWMSGPSVLPMNVLAFGITVTLALIAVQGASLAYTSGRWGAVWWWAGAAVAVVAAALVVLRRVGDQLPSSADLPAPRAVVVVVGVLLLIVGISRNSDTVLERETTDGDWFVLTDRVLRATQFWSGEQAREQMRRARAEFDHVQARRTQGSEQISPWDYFGTPEQYAVSMTSRPAPTEDPVRGGRWYYLITALVLGVWALWRTYSVGMSWLTVVLYFFGVVAVGMFVWASLKSRRR